MSKDKKAMRFAARLTAIFDWQNSEYRTMERLSKEECIIAVRGLSKITDNDVQKLWGLASNEFPHIGTKEIEGCEKWILPEVARVYDMQQREIKASIRLREVFEDEGMSLSDLESKTGQYRWTFYGWLHFTDRIPWLVVLSIESLDMSKTAWKTVDVFKEKDRLRRSFNEDHTRTEKKEESDSLST